MPWSDAELQRAHQQATRPRSRRDCPTGETLARAAASQLDRQESEQVADHLATCADCAEEYKLASSLGPWAETAAPPGTRARPPLQMLATAAAVLIAVSSAAWSYRSVGDARQLTERAEALAARSRDEAGALRRSLDEAVRPQADMLIADLYPPDALRGSRGTAEAHQTIAVPAGARWFTVILNTADAAERAPSAEYQLDIRDAAGTLVWQGRGLHRSRYHTFTVLLPSALLPDGRYRFVLTAPDASLPVQDYAVELRRQ